MALPRSPFWVVLLCFVLQAQSPTDGLQLFHRMQKAYGGADRIAAVRDFEQYESADTWNTDGTVRGTVRKHVRFIRPSYLRIDQVGPGDTYVLYFDGSSGWEILPDGKFQKLEGGELRFAEGYLGGLQLNSLLRDRDSDTIFTSSAPNTITISVRGNDKHKDEIILDPKTFLPVGGRGISLADPDHPVASATELHGWRVVKGVAFPTEIINYHDGKKLADITVTDTRIDTGLKPADLARTPTDLKPVM